MNTNHQKLLREFVKSELLGERLQGRGSFKLSEFKKLDLPFQMIDYVHDVLKLLGEGSSRATYLLSSSKVLKIARPIHEERGIAQNESEVDVFTNPVTRPIVTKIYDYDPNYNWLISETVRPINESDFKSAVGFAPKTIFSMLWEIAKGDEDVDDFLMKKGKIGKMFKEHTRDFMRSCLDLYDINDLSFGDLEKMSSWGKSADGRIVLLDYGLTESVYDTHYEKAVDQKGGTVRDV